MKQILNRSRSSSGVLAAQYAIFVPALLFLAVVPIGAASIKTWDGSSSGLWSVGANWSGGTKPQNGDQLRFPGGVTRRTLTNDISNLQVTSILFPDTGATNYVLRGNALTIGGASSPDVGGVQSNPSNGVNRIEFDVVLQRSDLGGSQNFLFIFPGTGSLIFSGDVAVAQDGVSLRSDPGSFLEFSGSITGTGSVFLVGAGTTAFDGTTANTCTGTTFVQHGTLQFNKSVFLVPVGFVARTSVAGDLVVSQSGVARLLFDDQIADSANVSVFTTLDLNGHDDVIGPLTISGGVVANGGTLGLNGDVAVSASGAIDAAVNLGSTTRNFVITNSGVSLQINGGISGTGGLTKTGAGTLTFAGPDSNTYSGATTVRGGVLQLNKPGLIAIQGSSLTIGDSSDGSATDTVRYLAGSQMSVGVDIFLNRTGLLDLNGFTDDLGDLNLTGGQIQTGEGTLQMSGNVTAIGDSSGFSFFPAQISGKLSLGTSIRTFTVNNNGFLLGLPDDLIVDAVVSGTGGITKAGAGEMELNGANTYSGATTVNAGTLVLGANSALGTASPGTVVNNDARVRLPGGLSVASEPLTLNSTASNPGALFGTGVSNFWGGNIFLNQTTHIGVETNSVLNLGGLISGPGDLEKQDDGELIFTGASSNTYSGLTTISGGTLFCNKSGFGGAIPGDVFVGDGVGGTNADILLYSLFQLTPGANVRVNSSGRYIVGADTIGSLAGDGNVDILTTGTLTVGGNNASTEFSGVISDGGALTKAGTGVFALSGNNTYTGDTTVQAGTLIVNGAQQGSDVTVLGNATLGGSGAVGNLNVATSGHVSPGSGPGDFIARSTVFSNDAVLHIELDGLVAGVSYDRLRIFGALTLTGSKLAPSISFAPFEGEVFTIIDNNGTDAVVGTFDNLANGAVTNVQGIPLRINYNGLTGNDVTLTVTNLAARLSTVTVQTGNADGRIDPNECNQLFLRVTNFSGAPLTNVHATLSSSTPGVVITAPSSAYPDMKTAAAAGTNLTAFQFFTDTNFLCGQSVEFFVTLAASNQTPFAIRFVLQSGTLGTSQSFTNSTGLGIPPVGTTASAIVVTNVPGSIAKVTVSMALTHQNLSELQLLLIPPAGPAIPLVAGLAGTQLGTNCTNGRLTFDDDAALPIEAGASPYVGTFRADAPLSLADGHSANGPWLLEIIDFISNSSVGALSCWSLTITPATCAVGGGPCAICNGPFFGSIATNDLALNGRLQSSGSPSFCGGVKACPPLSGLPTRYDLFTFTNGGPAACITVTLDSPCTDSTNSLACAAYLNAFNPANVCQNFLADIGSFTNSPSVYSFQVPSNAGFVVVVDGASGATCSDYTLRVDGFDCPVRLGAGRATNGGLTINWPNHANGFSLEWNTNLVSTNWLPMTNTVISSGSDFVITNDISAPNAFYRLRKTNP